MSEASKTFRSAQMDRLASLLKNKKVSFYKVIKMIDDMVVHLGEEQKDDDKQKAFCDGEIEKAGDEKAATEDTIKEVSAKMGELEELHLS